MMKNSVSMRKIATVLSVLLILPLLYLGLGLGFHFQWQSAKGACRTARMAQGEFVEPEVFNNAVGFVFDITFWPVYSAANLYHYGTPLATPCTH